MAEISRRAAMVFAAVAAFLRPRAASGAEAPKIKDSAATSAPGLSVPPGGGPIKESPTSPAGRPAPPSAHDFAFRAIEGGEMPLARFKGSAVLVVNTASQCGFTPQYANLQELWRRYRDRGMVVLGVPSNDFGGQEPGSDADIKKFCTVNFDVDFPLAAKETVKGDGAHPFYKWAAAELGAIAVPRWNFHKYLIAPDGRLADWFSTPTDPLSSKVTAAIEAVLPPSQNLRR